MFPKIHIAGYVLSSYYFSLLVGVIIGGILYILTELSKTSRRENKTFARTIFTIVVSAVSYFIVMLCAVQGATYFHFIFDVSSTFPKHMTLTDMLLTGPVDSPKVLYGAVFAYPLGIFLITFYDLKNKFFYYLNGKAFILFMVAGFNRIGCFLNGCCFGIRSETFGIQFLPGSAAAERHWGKSADLAFSPPVIPTQLFEAGALFLLAIYCWSAFKRGKQAVFLTAAFYYAVFRFIIEFIRDDPDRAQWWIFSASQWISIFIALVYFAYIIYKKCGGRKRA